MRFTALFERLAIDWLTGASRKAVSEGLGNATMEDPFWSHPRFIAEVNACLRPHLAIIDGIKTATGAETNYGRLPQAAVNPGVIIAGTNTVATDAVAMAVMGFDPLAETGKAPFAKCVSTLQLGEHFGVGIRDLKRNDVAGVPIAEALFDFSAVRERILRERKES